MNRRKRRAGRAASGHTPENRRVGLRAGTRRAAPSKRRTPAKRAAAVEQRAGAIFAQQIQAVWTRFGHECQEFAEGFNAEIGAHQLHVECSRDTIMARFAQGGEVFVQLDHDQQQIGCWLSSRCGDFGSCVVEQAPLGLTVENDRLRFVYGTSTMSEGDLAIKLLTGIFQVDEPATA
jgi:hypothetical protein